jgi:hypothetical protein
MLLNPISSFAEFYKYRDENGVVRYTDNLAEVPPAQRPKTQRYSEPDDFLTPAQKRQRDESASSKSSVPERESSLSMQREEEETVEQRSTRLRQLRENLKREYNEIARAQQALLNKRGTLRTPASYRKYNEQQSRLQQRAEAYEKRRKAFEEQVKAHNESIQPLEPIE